MTLLVDALTVALLLAAAFFFAAGTVGLLRFPDVYNRLHAVTKVDNLGLGFVAVAMMLQAESWAAIAKLALIWLLALLAAATAGYLVANSARRIGVAGVTARPAAGDEQ
ncbi:MAG TPA: monovalent cation/H(+) antiporter subunit G [Burkholderiaceae bacterium]|nr:monovalent cation/H(+) antiporter subunit G [Burkholderiaceae bacterium]